MAKHEHYFKKAHVRRKIDEDFVPRGRATTYKCRCGATLVWNKNKRERGYGILSEPPNITSPKRIKKFPWDQIERE